MAGKTIQDLPSDSGLNDGDLIEGQNTASGSYKTTLGKVKTYVTTTIQNSLNNKVDKVPGKQLSTEDYTSAEKSKLAGIQDQAQKNVINSIELNGQVQNPDSTGKVSLNVQSGGGAGDATQAGNNTFTGQNEYTRPLTIVDAVSGKHAVTKDQLDTKVDKSGNKQLSDENYTNAEKQKLAGLDSSFYAKLSQPNVFTGDNVFNQPVTVTGALQDDHAINKGQVDTVTGQLSSLTTNAKTSLVDAINEIKNSQTTGGYTLPVATDSVLGGVKAGTADGEVNVASDGKMSVWGWSTLNNKFNDYTTTSAMNLLFDAKVDKVPGKELSENDFTSVYKAQLDGLQAALDNKVDVDGSKVLSDENFTTALKNKLDGLNSSEYVKVNGGNIIADDNEFTSSLKVATATLGEHAVRKEQVDNVTGVLSNLQTGDKSNLVNAINEVANSLVTGGYILPQASDSALGGIKTGSANGDIQVDGGGKASVVGFDTKVDKDGAKVLSENDFTNAYKTQLDDLPTVLDTKVDVEAGKGLSENNFTNSYKSKLDNLDANLAAKADDSAVIKNTGDQSVDGKKTFNDYTLSKGIQVNTNIGVNLGSTDNLGAFDISHANGFYSLSNTGTRTAMIGRDSSTGNKLRLYNEVADTSMPNNRSPILVNCAIEFPSAYAPTNDLHAVNKAYVDNEVASLEQAISALQGGITIIGQIGSSKDDVTGNPDLLTQFVQTTASRPPRNGDMVRTSDSYAFVYNGSSWVNSGITGAGPASIADLGLIKLGAADGQLGDDNGIAKVNGWDTLNTKVDGKANDSDVVKISGNQTIGGEKTFSNDVFVNGALKAGSRLYFANSVPSISPNTDQTGTIYMANNLIGPNCYYNFDFENKGRIMRLADPQAGTDAANKNYVDSKFKIVTTTPTASDLAEGCMAVQV